MKAASERNFKVPHEAFALSTAWYPDASMPVSEVMRLVSELGVRKFEIGVSSNVLDLEAIRLMVTTSEVEVTSIHNICADVLYRGDGTRPREPRGDDLSSLDEARRKLAVEQTVETVRLARSLGAKAVILHLGRVEFPEARRLQAELCLMLKNSTGREEVSRQMSHLIVQRNSLRAPYLEVVKRSLDEILYRTEEVSLALEGRYHFHEIPSLDEVGFLFERVPSERLGYWHDTGHSQLGEILWNSRQEDWLKSYAPRLIGIHLHDVRECQDHLPPGQGELDFGRILSLVPAQALRVVEVAPNVALEDVLRSFDFLSRVEDFSAR